MGASNIQEAIQIIKDSKLDIRQSIVDKGGSIAGDDGILSPLQNYSNAIDNISSGGANLWHIDYGMRLGYSTWSEVPEEYIQLLNATIPCPMSNMFYYCSNLTTVPLFDTSNVTNMSYMFYYCSNLTTVPLYDTSNVTNMSYMFNNCQQLPTVPQFNTSNVTDMKYMFYNGIKLSTVPLFDTSNVTDMRYMFYNCQQLPTVPQFNTSNVTDMSYMFGGCTRLLDCPINFKFIDYNTYSGLFNGCTGLIKISEIDFDKWGYYNSNAIFNGSPVNHKNLRYFLIKNIGKLSNFTTLPVSYTQLDNWGVEDEGIPLSIGARQSLIDTLLTYSFDRAAAGYSTMTIKLSENTYALLTESELEQITAKGYTITT